MVHVDPLTTAIGFLHLQVEFVLPPRWSAYVAPHVRVFDGILESVNGDYVGLGIEAVVRFYPWDLAPEGFWVGPRGVLALLRSRDEARAGGYVSILGGYTWFVADYFVLALGLGVSYFDYRIDTADVHGFLPAAHTALGLAFW